MIWQPSKLINAGDIQRAIIMGPSIFEELAWHFALNKIENHSIDVRVGLQTKNLHHSINSSGCWTPRYSILFCGLLFSFFVHNLFYSISFPSINWSEKRRKKNYSTFFVVVFFCFHSHWCQSIEFDCVFVWMSLICMCMIQWINDQREYI